MPALPPVTRQTSLRIWLIGVGLSLIVGLAVGVIVRLVSGSPKIVSMPVTMPFENTFPTSNIPSDAEIFAPYAGAATCQSCHPNEFAAWSTSHHGQAERPFDLKHDRLAFDPARSFVHGEQTSRVEIKNDKPSVTAIGASGKSAVNLVERVIGVEPLRQFLVSAGAGRFQALDVSYDPHQNEWFNVFGAQNRQPDEWGHWTNRGMNWNSMCAGCHNTRVRKHYNPATDAYATTMAQATVSCEACHGPLKSHNQWQAAHAASPAPDPTLKKIGKDQMLDTCGSCHARREELTGEFSPGQSFDDHYSLAIPDLSNTFHADGQIHDEDYEFTSFKSSKMHAAGVRCVDCHEPHTAKTLLPGNNLCMRCHNGSFKGSPVIVPESHSFHRADSTGNQCVNCHMPQTTYMERHGRHDHGFTIPDPLLTTQFGTPNACNRCHTDKDSKWAQAAAEKWYGEKMNRPTRDRALAIAKARAGDESARIALLGTLKNDKQPFWRAVAARAVAPWASQQEVSAALIESLDNPDALVRENAAKSLEPLAQAGHAPSRSALARRLADPVRSVRTRVAWALRDMVDLRSPAASDLFAYFNQTADQPTGLMQQGLFRQSRGEVDGAIALFRKAILWDAHSAPLYESLAIALSMKSDPRGAVEQLSRAVAIDPNDPELRFRLGLAYSENQQPVEAIKALEIALLMNPRHPRAAYNLGLLYSTVGQTAQAIETLAKAEQIAPDDPQIPYERARIHLSQGQRTQAREAALKALQINSDFRPAANLLQKLQ